MTGVSGMVSNRYPQKRVTVFAGRLYGHRAKGIRKRVQIALQAYETGEDLHRTTNGTGEQDHQTAS